jgi:hypothetical protein
MYAFFLFLLRVHEATSCILSLTFIFSFYLDSMHWAAYWEALITFGNEENG